MFNLFGINFFWYGILIGIGVWVAMEISLANRGSIKKDVLERAILLSVVGGVIGARMYHVIDYWSRYYSANFLKSFYFWEGGLGIWGAIIGGAIGLYLFCYFNKLKFINFADVVLIGMPLAQVIGRIGNFINGEIVGKNGEPLFAYEGFLNLILFLVLWRVSKKSNKPGLITGMYFVGYGLIRVILENFRPNDLIWRVQNIPVAVIFAAFAILVGIYLIFRKRQS